MECCLIMSEILRMLIKKVLLFFCLSDELPPLSKEKKTLIVIFNCRYKIMNDCWRAKPTARPTFTDLVDSIGNLLDESVKMVIYIFKLFFQ